MALSFQLNLTPAQIEFLQALDLYADGVTDVLAAFDLSPLSMVWCRKLIRDGLVQHHPPTVARNADPAFRAYTITPKGRQVLSLVEQDVEAFLARQRKYQDAKKNARKKGA